MLVQLLNSLRLSKIWDTLTIEKMKVTGQEEIKWGLMNYDNGGRRYVSYIVKGCLRSWQGEHVEVIHDVVKEQKLWAQVTSAIIRPLVSTGTQRK